MKKSSIKSIGAMGRSAIALIALFVILAAVNVITDNLRLRVDLTQEKLYSLSDGTRHLIGTLDQPVTLKLFFSSSNPRMPSQLGNYAKQVEDLLVEYKIAAKGNITFQKLDPKPDSDEEEWARKYGIAGQALEMYGDPVYFGLVASAGSTEAVLPVLDPRMQQTLEFNISRMIHQVTNLHKPVIGVVSSLPVLGEAPPSMAMPGQPPAQQKPAWIAFQELQKDFDVRNIDDPENGIAKDIDTLIIVHPKHLSPKAQFAIDQHVLGGGRLILFVDPLSIADQESAPMSPYGMPEVESDMPDLLKAWGIHYQTSQILADFQAATPMRTPEGGIENNAAVVTYTDASLDKKNIMTAGLQSIRAAFAGVLSVTPIEKIKVTPLITASEQSGSAPAMAVRNGSRALREQFMAAPEPQYLAVQLSGTFQTAFPNGRPEDESEKPEDQTTPVTEEILKSGDSAIIVIADVDMLFDPICVEAINFFGQTAQRPLNDNLAFFANIVESMAGGHDLISIRARGNFNRPFTRVDALEAIAVAHWQEQEAQLEASLRSAQQQLNQLQAGKEADQRFILTDNQRGAIEKYKKREFEIKQQLKEVRKSLRNDIEKLGFRVKAINIILMPLLVGLAGIAYATFRKRN